MNNPNCPGCGKPLQKVKQSANSMLNAEQFDAARAGDWFCSTCPGNNQARTGYRYFWDKDLAAWGRDMTAPQAASQQAAPYFRDIEFDPPSGLFTTASSLDRAAPQAATTAACQPSTLTGQPDAAICQPAATTASASAIKTWQERTPFQQPWAMDATQWEIHRAKDAEISDLRAALARAPLPAQQVQAVDVARDAARYRWLRLHRVIEQDERGIPWVVQLDPAQRVPTSIRCAESNLDQAIDAAMSRTNTTGGSKE